MSSQVLALLFLTIKLASSTMDPNKGDFSFNGFLDVGGIAKFQPDGLFTLTNSTKQGVGQIFYKFPVQFKSSTKSSAFSFSTTFVFAIRPEYSTLSGHGISFVLSPNKGIPGGLPSQYLGLFNESSMGESSNHIIAIELDTIESNEFKDINDNHVGIDINSLVSVKSAPAGYFDLDGGFHHLSLISGEPMQVWVEYSGDEKQLNVTLYPIDIAKPKRPLVSLHQDLSLYLKNFMYVGFSSSTGSVLSSHYILGWSFKTNGEAAPIDLSRLPKLPRNPYGREGFQELGKILAITLSLSGITLLLVFALGFYLFLKRKRFVEVLEDWEFQYGPLRFTYKELFVATKGFNEKELLGKGGFGRVYRGTLSSFNTQAAVKRISHDSSQGVREFVAEIATIGRLRHPNLVRLLGYCRHKGDLYLVYDFMPNGSLDKFLYQTPNQKLSWNQRFKIIKDVASALFYLHQQWVQVVIHRDVKPANILMDNDMNARLGDFGLAKLCDHGIDPQTSRIAGTLGYISPELARTGKASTSSDVFAFGVFMLEITCNRRPIEPRSCPNETVLVDWVSDCWDKGGLLRTVDKRLGGDYIKEQVEMVLKLGLLCAHPEAAVRPSMSAVRQFLDGAAQLPENLFDILKMTGEATPSSDPLHAATITITESFTSHGR